MTHLAFYFGDQPDLAKRLRTECVQIWGEVAEYSSGRFILFVPTKDAVMSVGQTDAVVGAVSGYVREETLPHCDTSCERHEQAHNEKFLSTIGVDQEWPLGNAWTGTFSAVAYSKQGDYVVICNDLIGHIPIYFCQHRGELLGGTSQIILGRTISAEPDVVGILQQIRSPFCTHGRRTILKGVCRPLPGEWLKVVPGRAGFQSHFDNSLYSSVLAGDINKVARDTWDCLREEIQLAVGTPDRLCIALSGGWDSRLLLGGIGLRSDTIDCFTYGNEENYEPQVARRCAQAVGASHRCFPIQNKYFPDRKEFIDLVRETESAIYMVWFTIIDAVKNSGRTKDMILLGDHCESVDGRNITSLSSRKNRVNTVIHELLGSSPSSLQPATRSRFAAWRDSSLKAAVAGIQPAIGRLSPALQSQHTLAEITEQTLEDAKLCCQRVEDNLPPFVPLFDELFAWHHKARHCVASQNLFLSSTFRPLSPTMSVRSLRAVSKVHPYLRLRRRLMDAIARLPEFDVLSRIPSAQIPWISARAAAPIREAVWAFRSGTDNVLTRRIMATKDANRRQRVLKSLDMIAEYQRPGTITTIDRWFSGNWISADGYLMKAQRRAQLADWPLVNLDIAVAANVSMIFDLCGTA